uniref:Uncharacterized protein n=1 Tax=Romanomermis culicivorax TaxID=13658 RepID=A0A915HRS8_ROMCU
MFEKAQKRLKMLTLSGSHRTHLITLCKLRHVHVGYWWRIGYFWLRRAPCCVPKPKLNKCIKLIDDHYFQAKVIEVDFPIPQGCVYRNSDYCIDHLKKKG